jgi:hypothetical protein
MMHGKYSMTCEYGVQMLADSGLLSTFPELHDSHAMRDSAVCFSHWLNLMGARQEFRD